jgi:hypothetical protein
VRVKEVFYAWGHFNVKATHRTTLEITKEEHLTPRGDCIIAIKSEKSVSDLDPEVKQAIRCEDAKVSLMLRLLDLEEVISGRGSERLLLMSPLSMVCRKSDYICPRTLMIRCDKAAIDISRELIEHLKKGLRLQVILEAEV